jgi:hypothetical protein
MSDELEAFLRRAAQKRQKRRPAEIVLIEPGVEPLELEPVPERPSFASLPPHAETKSSAPPSRPEPPSPSRPGPPQRRGEKRQRRETPAAPQRRSLDEQPMAEHRLGDLQQQAESRRVEGVDEEGGVLGAHLAQEIIQMLQSPGGARRAFILQEILTPPVHRWED